MTVREYYPCNKLIQWLLLENRKSIWKINQKITYNKFLPRSKQFINYWINGNLFGPTKLMLLETMKTISCPKTLASRYKKFHSDIWTILEDPKIREIVEIDSLYGRSPIEIYDRLNSIIKHRIVNVKAIEQFLYFFWNLEDDGAFRPALALKLIETSRELSRAYRHVLKYFKEKNGFIRYEYFYHLNKSLEPNLSNVYKVLDLLVIEQIDSLENDNYDKVEVLSDILLKNAEVLKILKTLSNSSGNHSLADIFQLKDE